mgnify:CR=1 FL=1
MRAWSDLARSLPGGNGRREADRRRHPLRRQARRWWPHPRAGDGPHPPSNGAAHRERSAPTAAHRPAAVCETAEDPKARARGHGRARGAHAHSYATSYARWGAERVRGERFVIRDNDDKFGGDFDRVAKTSGIRVLRTPVRAPKANAVCERYLGNVRRECLDHIVILSERHMLRMLKQHVAHFNRGRPHQGIGQRVPAGPVAHDDGGRRGERSAQRTSSSSISNSRIASGGIAGGCPRAP